MPRSLYTSKHDAMPKHGLFDQEAESDIQCAFEAFHRRNPRVYDTLVALARRGKQRGARTLGIGMLWEVMRWELYVATDTPNETEQWRLNNNFRSRYARMIMQCEPDLSSIFETRELRA